MTTELDRLAPLMMLIDCDLEARLPSNDALAPQLLEAMRYAVLGGGKRIRPLLTCATAECLGGDPRDALAGACAVEFIHAYSLIHDDLPAMDDDDLRRGRPTVHRAFGEAIAILAGDALQALAFETLTRDSAVPAAIRLTMVESLARAAGWAGMVGGQTSDIDAASRPVSIEALEAMHRAKTGALICAAIDLGALAARASASTRGQLEAFGRAIGLAFQVVDDLLDVTGTTAQLGKRVHADEAAGKSTFPGLLGVAATRTRAAALHEEAIAALRRAGIAAGPLHAIAQRVVERTR
jgi:geranylgeranyl pyrophosphate synthase